MKKLKNILYHRKNERRGLWVFLFVMTLGLIGRYAFLRWYIPEKQNYDDLIADAQFVDARENTYTRKPRKNDQRKSSYLRKPKREIQRFAFDPNTISKDSLVLLGIPKYIASNLEKYRSKGGRFRKAKDFKRIYGMDKYYEDIAELITIESVEKSTKPKTIPKPEIETNVDTNHRVIKQKEKTYPKKQRVVVELNGADIEKLEKLHGIGPFYAKMIVEYREKLGGYYTPEQIIEAYKIPDTILTTIGKEWITVDISNIQKIDLNTADFKTLVRHPYINKNQTNAILKYRKVHGKYTSVEEIQKIVIIKEKDYVRLKPYLTVS